MRAVLFWALFAAPAPAAVDWNGYFHQDYGPWKGYQHTAIYDVKPTDPNLPCLILWVSRPAERDTVRRFTTTIKILGTENKREPLIHHCDSFDVSQLIVGPTGNFRIAQITDVELRGKWLEAGRKARPNPAPTLSAEDRARFLAEESPYLDLGNTVFQDFLTTNKLRIDPRRETTIGFMHRAVTTVVAPRQYGGENIAKPLSTECQQTRLVCGSVSHLIVGIARANGIPARMKEYFMINLQKNLPPIIPTNMVATLNPNDPILYTHARVDYWDERLGWLSCEPTMGLGRPQQSIDFGFCMEDYRGIPLTDHNPTKIQIFDTYAVTCGTLACPLVANRNQLTLTGHWTTQEVAVPPDGTKPEPLDPRWITMFPAPVPADAPH